MHVESAHIVSTDDDHMDFSLASSQTLARMLNSRGVHTTDEELRHLNDAREQLRRRQMNQKGDAK